LYGLSQEADVIHLLTQDRRVTVNAPPADLAPLIDYTSLELREAMFRYSASVVAGQRCDFRFNEYKQQKTEE